MAKTPSQELPIGMEAPHFELKDALTGNLLDLNSFEPEHGLVIAFICNHCPYVKHILPAFLAVAEQYREKGIDFVFISSNDVENYPEDSFENMVKLTEEMDFNIPYLFDESQEIAKKYKAECTPDIYLFDDNKKLYYHGQFDNSRPDKGMASGDDLRKAMDMLIKGEPAPEEQVPSIGCNIKWKQD